jgi:hypothetical protein
LTFAWRAFLSVAVEVKPTQPLDVDLVVVNTHPSTIEVWFGTHNEPSLAGVASVAASQNGTSKFACTDASDPLQFAHLAMSDGASEGCFALGLVEDLLQVRGGKLEMWGSPREAAGMRITLPADL